MPVAPVLEGASLGRGNVSNGRDERTGTRLGWWECGGGRMDVVGSRQQNEEQTKQQEFSITPLWLPL